MAAILGLIAVAACADGRPSRAPAPGAQSYHFSDQRKGFAEIPFEVAGNNILVPVRLNQSAPVWMVIDTGAGPNVIVDSVASRVRLGSSAEAQLQAGGGDVHGGVATGVTIALPGVSVDGQSIVVAPIPHLSSYFGRDVAGFVGMEFLRNFVIELNYDRRIMTLSDPQRAGLADNPAALPIQNRSGNPFVAAELSIAGRDAPVHEWLEIDSGSSYAVSFNRPFAEGLQLLGPGSHVVEGVGGAGAGGPTAALEMRLEAITVGRFRLNRPVVRLSQDENGAGAGNDFAGFLGTDVLRHFDVKIDFLSQRILLTPGAHFNDPFESDMSGLELVTRDGDYDTIEVLRVRSGFPGAEIGLREGDVIVAVDGNRAGRIGLSRLSEMFKRDGARYVLTVRRGDQAFETTLNLRRRL